MFYHLLVATAGIAALAGLWVAVQALVRRSSTEYGPESDVLECKTCGTGHTCRHCGQDPGAVPLEDETQNKSS